MTREIAIKELKKAEKNRNTVHSHQGADDILCKLLIELGYADVVAEYEKVRKWYE